MALPSIRPTSLMFYHELRRGAQGEELLNDAAAELLVLFAVEDVHPPRALQSKRSSNWMVNNELQEGTDRVVKLYENAFVVLMRALYLRVSGYTDEAMPTFLADNPSINEDLLGYLPRTVQFVELAYKNIFTIGFGEKSLVRAMKPMLRSTLWCKEDMQSAHSLGMTIKVTQPTQISGSELYSAILKSLAGPNPFGSVTDKESHILRGGAAPTSPIPSLRLKQMIESLPSSTHDEGSLITLSMRTYVRLEEQEEYLEGTLQVNVRLWQTLERFLNRNKCGTSIKAFTIHLTHFVYGDGENMLEDILQIKWPTENDTKAAHLTMVKLVAFVEKYHHDRLGPWTVDCLVLSIGRYFKVQEKLCKCVGIWDDETLLLESHTDADFTPFYILRSTPEADGR